MKTTDYVRCEPISWHELPLPQKDVWEGEEESMFVKDPLREDEYLPLSHFMYLGKGHTLRGDGGFAQTAFNGYLVLFSRDMSECIVSHQIF